MILLQSLRSTSKISFGKDMKEATLDHALSITQLQRHRRIDDACRKQDEHRLAEEQQNPGHTNWKPEEHTDWLLFEIDADIIIRDDQINVARATISPAFGLNCVLQMNMGQGKTSVIMPILASAIADGKGIARLVVPRALLLQTAQILQARLGGLVGREVSHVPFSRKTPIGIMLTQPDHVLSSRLSGLQVTSDNHMESAQVMIPMQTWLDQFSRDVVDECDFALAVKTQLIYPSGTQLAVDGHPHRWTVPQILLGVLETYMKEMRLSDPLSFDLRLVEDICNGKLPLLPWVSQNRIESVRSYLLEFNIPEGTAESAYTVFPDQSPARQTLCILRGLLVHGILFLCLKKRWNVQYGLHPGRDTIAVPFHAKGIPSEQAEWGHPDVAIVLTCLAFYYKGLTETWNHLRFEQVVINDYLNDFVFPVHAKQFKSKLQASGLDIPSFSQGTRRPHSLTTGFSGTNDNKRMLPLTIRQGDLPALSHTNAEVLAYLLEPRNREYTVAEGFMGKRLSETEFLCRLKESKIRILIDAGAHILEFDNRGLARQWLTIDYEAAAAVYFNAVNKSSVIYRNGTEVPLLASPFAEDLSGCLVYLDEAHTRGTDLKFPMKARGALTLSLGQTNDHTVQAAMRLRQLGHSQSIMFVGSPEVHQSIKDHSGKCFVDRFESHDVVRWLLEQTCRANEELRPLYLAQGFDFCSRQDANSLLQPEQQTLEQLYHPSNAETVRHRSSCGNGQVHKFWTGRSPSRLRRCDRRQAQMPQHFPAHKFPGRGAELLHFSKTGSIRTHGWYEPMFNAIRRTRTGMTRNVPARNTNVLVSTEFTRTIKIGNKQSWRDDFLRPINWILRSPTAGKAVVIIPEEAERLSPILRDVNPPRTYLIVYSAPISKQMLHFNTFRYYTVPELKTDLPPLVKLELGILAGRLYFSFDECQPIVRYLDPHAFLHSDNDEASKKAASSNLLSRRFLEEWFSLMIKGGSFTYTPMGYVCRGTAS
ncbi:hypothetical protein BO71DRAFT_474570 [Aspergillus ellipticus CBS 707.79]|uniref:ubiquitinyl hydrolase 1 n=1 Tax=Aspergillus ellipticus CBS 707.79 TaxID=1448320 RepID=A0A319DCE0_9EURO|nr:hypothetical protein BO71DRAFT_474570 [Aspergillus ellipticus CBS 707.79]